IRDKLVTGVQTCALPISVCECLVGVLIDAGIIKTVSVGCVGIQRKTLVCANAIRGEARVVIGESETRPKEQTTADLRGCGGSRSQPEGRLDALKDVAHALVGDRSEEHTSELQSLAYLVCRLLLEK